MPDCSKVAQSRINGMRSFSHFFPFSRCPLLLPANFQKKNPQPQPNSRDSATLHLLPHATPANGAAAAAAANASAKAAPASAVVATGTASVFLRPAPAAVLSRAPAAAAVVVVAEEKVAVATAETEKSPTFSPDPDTSRDGWHADGSFRVAMSPRPHEIDEFGVVNNTYYNTFM